MNIIFITLILVVAVGMLAIISFMLVERADLIKNCRCSKWSAVAMAKANQSSGLVGINYFETECEEYTCPFWVFGLRMIE